MRRTFSLEDVLALGIGPRVCPWGWGTSNGTKSPFTSAKPLGYVGVCDQEQGVIKSSTRAGAAGAGGGASDEERKKWAKEALKNAGKTQKDSEAKTPTPLETP